MKITNIRVRHQKPTGEELHKITRELLVALTKAGFVCDVKPISSSGINMSLGATTFKVDTERLGWNANVGYYEGNGVVVQRDQGKGFIRTASPTWEQRVEFNHIINRVLDKNHVDADVKAAGGFVVRTSDEGGVSDWKWDPKRSGTLIVPEKEAAERFARPKRTENGTGQRRFPELKDFILHPFNPQDRETKRVSAAY